MEIAQLAIYAILARQHPLLITYVLKTIIVCMELEWQHHAKVAPSAQLKEEFRALTALFVRLDRFAVETRSLKIAH